MIIKAEIHSLEPLIRPMYTIWFRQLNNKIYVNNPIVEYLL